ncbi:glucose-1-phosphate thymidylyltransferase RfbA [Verrucomicrobia bacterium]|nr:glucose-1-phosphate thymidylyltransferase RfbA [Verrucomicrobiota bacterium]
MKGIILAGGSGTRLYPLTAAVSKQMLPIYNKPMVYYPLSVLMLARIKEILIITTREDNDIYRKLLGDGSNYGIKLSYAIQDSPNGLADAFIIGEDFINNDDVCLILGDNIFYGGQLKQIISKGINTVIKKNEACIFGHQVSDPSRYGVMVIDGNSNVLKIEEKPKKPKSNIAVVGLYLYPNDVVAKAKKIQPSSRGELEITSINNLYIKEKRLKIEQLGRGFGWLDTGTYESLIDASIFIRTIEKRTGLKIGCLEEIALNNEWITTNQLESLINQLKESDYKNYLKSIIYERN